MNRQRLQPLPDDIRLLCETKARAMPEWGEQHVLLFHAVCGEGQWPLDLAAENAFGVGTDVDYRQVWAEIVNSLRRPA